MLGSARDPAERPSRRAPQGGEVAGNLGRDRLRRARPRRHADVVPLDVARIGYLPDLDVVGRRTRPLEGDELLGNIGHETWEAVTTGPFAHWGVFENSSAEIQAAYDQHADYIIFRPDSRLKVGRPKELFEDSAPCAPLASLNEWSGMPPRAPPPKGGPGPPSGACGRFRVLLFIACIGAVVVLVGCG